MEKNMNNENENTNWIRKIFILSKKSRIIIGIIIILLIILFIIFGIKRKPDIDTTYLTQILTKSSELTTAKLRITGLSDYHDQGVYILNRSDFTMCYTTTIRAGINLDDVKIIKIQKNGFLRNNSIVNVFINSFIQLFSII